LRSKCDQQPSYTTACCKTCTCDRLDGHFIDNWQHEFVVNQHGCTVLFTYQGTQKMAQLYGKDVQIQGWSKGTIGPQGNNVKFADGGKWHKLAIKALLQVKEVHLDGEQTTTTAATDKEVHLDGEQTTTTAAADAKTTDAAPTEAPCKKDDEKAAIAAAWKNGKHVNGCEDLRSKCDQDESYQRACCATCNCGQLDGHFVDNWEQEIVVSQHGCAIMFTYEGKQKWAKIEGNQLHVQGWAKGKVQPGNWKVTFDDGGTWRRLAARAR
jgi:hypothetical protein